MERTHLRVRASFRPREVDERQPPHHGAEGRGVGRGGATGGGRWLVGGRGGVGEPGTDLRAFVPGGANATCAAVSYSVIWHIAWERDTEGVGVPGYNGIGVCQAGQGHTWQTAWEQNRGGLACLDHMHVAFPGRPRAHLADCVGAGRLVVALRRVGGAVAVARVDHAHQGRGVVHR